jgi:sulfur carrier protein
MIYINDKTYDFVQTQSIDDLMRTLKMDIGKGVAIALNNNVIPRSEWRSCVVNRNDKLILIKATQGG